MKLLVITQVVDKRDTTLGFFHRWLEEFSKRTKKINVICLKVGESDLPKNVSIFSLGKEKIETLDTKCKGQLRKIKYILNFYKYIWQLRGEYDTVFVHMNQEYLILAGPLWRLFGKKVFFWRNHPHGDLITRISLLFVHTVFYTSTHSFTSGNSKSQIMPAGIDTKTFNKIQCGIREKSSLLMFGRIAPIKHIEKAIDAIALLALKGRTVRLSIVGDALEKDIGYLETLKDRVNASGIQDRVIFQKGVPFEEALIIFQSHEIFLNFTPSGSFDKMVIEALACGARVLVSNTSMKDILPQYSYTSGDIEDIAKKIERLLDLDAVQLDGYSEDSRIVVQKQSLDFLMEKLFGFLGK